MSRLLRGASVAPWRKRASPCALSAPGRGASGTLRLERASWRTLSTATHEAYGWNPETNPVPDNAPWLDQMTVQWPSDPHENFVAWLEATEGQTLPKIKQEFHTNGFAVVRNVASVEELDIYRDMHDNMQSGVISTPGRHDLGSHGGEREDGLENVGQIMWPSDLVKGGREGPLHARAFHLSKALLGEDMRFDFDMLIYKDAQTNTETPWHQDEAYWPSGIEDKRALTMWMALDDAFSENGAMWYIPDRTQDSCSSTARLQTAHTSCNAMPNYSTTMQFAWS